MLKNVRKTLIVAAITGTLVTVPSGTAAADEGLDPNAAPGPDAVDFDPNVPPAPDAFASGAPDDAPAPELVGFDPNVPPPAAPDAVIAPVDLPDGPARTPRRRPRNRWTSTRTWRRRRPPTFHLRRRLRGRTA